jgi:hypothetical protein
MAETAKLTLPLLEAAQAQKHVTVNEALVRLDAAAHLTLLSVSTATPPGLATEGDCYGVPTGAVNEWAGQAGRVAIHSNGGWQFLDATTGWRAWVADAGAVALYETDDWQIGAETLSANGAGQLARVVEVDHSIAAGPTSTTAAIIPSGAIVLGVTGRVLTLITGAASSWRLGIAGVSDDRYGAGIGLGAGSWMRGVTGTPQAYFADTALTLSGEGGDFAAGTVRLAVHFIELGLPRA